MELTAVSLEVARATDAPLVRGLLATSGLSLEGLSDQFPSAYVVAFARGVVVGAAGLESYGTVGLLRSVAVTDGLNGMSEELAAFAQGPWGRKFPTVAAT